MWLIFFNWELGVGFGVMLFVIVIVGIGVIGVIVLLNVIFG